MKKIIIIFCAMLFMVNVSNAEMKKYKSQTVYVPAYSHIYVGPRDTPFDLAITLSIRNTNATESMSVTVADYYDSNGKAVKGFIDQPVILKPFATIRYIVSESNKQGGSGANFLVKWYSDKEINAPVIETVMIGTRSSQGISFTSRGVVIGD
ncbi:MAG: hypothetical protein C0603_00925 [Denitrovibrio sp.]|nr:MAG: hypothetical protein C0603_00925 [Denitrovibrio sp.]